MIVRMKKIGDRIICRRKINFEKAKFFVKGVFIGFLGTMLLYSLVR